MGAASATSKRTRKQPSKSVGSWQTSAPYSSACESLAAEIFAWGTRTRAPSPARAAYAAMDAEVFPVEAQATHETPSTSALETTVVIPVSLKEPVGFMP